MLDSEASPEFCRFASEPRTTRSKAARRSWVFPVFCPALIGTLRTAAKPKPIPILIRHEIGRKTTLGSDSALNAAEIIPRPEGHSSGRIRRKAL